MLVSGMEKLNSADARGTFGYSGGFGKMQFSYNRFGFYTKYAGIFSRKKTLKGKQLSQMRFYRPTNPQTTEQQAWRAVFAAGKVAYDALTSGEKLLLSKHGRKLRMSGYNLFMRRWLRNHT